MGLDQQNANQTSRSIYQLQYPLTALAIVTALSTFKNPSGAIQGQTMAIDRQTAAIQEASKKQTEATAKQTEAIIEAVRKSLAEKK